MSNHIRSRRSSDRSSRLAGASILIALGIFFLLQQQQLIPNSLNWWAVFIVIPGLLMIYDGLSQQRNTGTIDSGKTIFGAALAFLGSIFLFNIQIDFMPDLPWNIIWPALMLAAGVILLLRRDTGTED